MASEHKTDVVSLCCSLFFFSLSLEHDWVHTYRVRPHSRFLPAAHPVVVVPYHTDDSASRLVIQLFSSFCFFDRHCLLSLSPSSLFPSSCISTQLTLRGTYRFTFLFTQPTLSNAYALYHTAIRSSSTRINADIPPATLTFRYVLPSAPRIIVDSLSFSFLLHAFTRPLESSHDSVSPPPSFRDALWG